jgi:LysM repeat protein
MKKTLGIVLSLSLLLSMASPVFGADTATSASVPAPGSAAPVKVSAPVNATIDTSKLEPGAVYTVVSGDTFSAIAWKYGVSIDALAKLNPHIKDINWIFVGDKIVVKAAPAPAPAAPAPKPTVDKAPYEAAQKEGYEWETKREEGYNYDMTHKISKGAADNLSGKEWFEQLDSYEKFFTGKTVAEVEAWFKKYTDANGRPFKMAYLNNSKIAAADKAAAEAASASFTADEKKMLVDVTTGATMALQDPHSRFIESLQEAWTTKKVLADTKLYHGIGNVANYRIRNGNNDNLNVTSASAIFDEAGKIVQLEWDVLEITPTMFQWLPAQQ